VDNYDNQRPSSNKTCHGQVGYQRKCELILVEKGGQKGILIGLARRSRGPLDRASILRFLAWPTPEATAD